MHSPAPRSPTDESPPPTTSKYCRRRLAAAPVAAALVAAARAAACAAVGRAEAVVVDARAVSSVVWHEVLVDLAGVASSPNSVLIRLVAAGAAVGRDAAACWDVVVSKMSECARVRLG